MEGRPRRSVLYMPGSNARALEKAKTLSADALIFDLEDAVAPDDKELAREQVCAAVSAGGYGGREVVIRVNALETPWGAADIIAACEAAPDAILIPKVIHSGDIISAAKLLPDQWDVQFMGGQAHFQKWEWREAEAHFERTIELNPSPGDAYILAADAARRDRRIDRAEHWLREALEQLPSDPRAYALLSDVLAEAGRRGSARELRIALVEFYVQRGQRQLDERFFQPRNGQ